MVVENSFGALKFGEMQEFACGLASMFVSPEVQSVVMRIAVEMHSSYDNQGTFVERNGEQLLAVLYE